MARDVFVAKECVYKCQYPVTGAFLEFGDVKVTLPAEHPAGFCATATALPNADLRGKISA